MKSFFNIVTYVHTIYWLNRLKIKNYEIIKNEKSEIVVDVFGDVDIKGMSIKEIPIQFNIVRGSFDCSCNHLKSLKNSPQIVFGNFVCALNNLESLKYSPKEVYKNYICSNNDKLFLTQNNELTNNVVDNIFNFNCNIKGNFIHLSSKQRIIKELSNLYTKVSYYTMKITPQMVEINISGENLKKIISSYNLNEKLQKELKNKDNSKKLKI